MVFMSKDKSELIITCKCGCEDAVHLSIQPDSDDDSFAFLTYLKGNFYAEQGETHLRILGKKLRKIWAIIRNKDYYYSDILLSKDDFNLLVKYLNNLKTKE